MEYLQWQVKDDKDQIDHYVALRFNNEERSDKFDETIGQAAENFGMEYKKSENKNSILSYRNKNLNDSLNVAMKMFELYLTVKNQ